MEIRKFVAPEFIFGENSIELVGIYANNFAAYRVLVVSDPGVIAAGWTKIVEKKLHELNISYSLFKDLTPNPKDFEVTNGAEFYKSEQCDVIVAVGGGSVMDCAKAIGIVVTNNKNVLEFEGIDEVKIPGPPLICIPTTAGTAADISQFSIITDSKQKNKIAIISKTMIPDVSLVDPITTTTMSRELTAATGMDALVHAFEAYVSNASSPFTDIHAFNAVKLVSENLLKVYNDSDNLEYRENMMLASTFAGLAFSNASLGLVHSMAHSLGGFLDLAHGDCNAILLEHVIECNYESAENRYKELASAMGIDKDGFSPKKIKQLLINEIKVLREQFGINESLGSLGVSKSDIKKLSKTTLNDPCSATNPRELNIKIIESVYEKAL